MKRVMMIVLTMTLSLFAAEEKKAPRPSLVVTAPVVKGSVNPLQTYVGTLYYDKKSDLASEFSGLVDELFLKEGQHVRQGEVLVRLDSKVLALNIAAKEAGVKALQADVTRQERDLERTKVLFERHSISQSSYDQVFYAYEKVQAELMGLKNQLKAMQTQAQKMQIRAPFDGIVSSRSVEVGEWVGQGSPIGTLIASNSLEVRLNIPTTQLETLSSYKSFKATVDGKEVQVELKSIVPVADVSTRTFPVEMQIKQSDGLIEGMRIDVQVPLLKEQNSLMVPRDAVIKRFGQTVVFVNKNGTAMMMPVEVIGYKKNQAAIVAKGLQENMKVVIKGNERIFPNMPIVEKAH